MNEFVRPQLKFIRQGDGVYLERPDRAKLDKLDTAHASVRALLDAFAKFGNVVYGVVTENRECEFLGKPDPRAGVVMVLHNREDQA